MRYSAGPSIPPGGRSCRRQGWPEYRAEGWLGRAPAEGRALLQHIREAGAANLRVAGDRLPSPLPDFSRCGRQLMQLHVYDRAGRPRLTMNGRVDPPGLRQEYAAPV